MRDVSLLVAVITMVSSFYVSIVMTYWWRKLFRTNTNLRPLILAISMAKLSLFFWSVTGVFQIVVLDLTPPLVTFPARLFFMVAALIQAYVTTKYYHIESTPDPLGAFEKHDSEAEGTLQKNLTNYQRSQERKEIAGLG